MITTDVLLDLPGVTQSPAALHRARVEEAPDRLWLLDLSQFWAATRWLYFGYVLDCHSGRCLGVSAHRVPHADLLARALRLAVAERNGSAAMAPEVAVVFGRRCHLAELQHPRWAVPAGHHLARAESFLASMRRQLVDDVEWVTESDARNALEHWVEEVYNPALAPSSNGHGVNGHGNGDEARRNGDGPTRTRSSSNGSASRNGHRLAGVTAAGHGRRSVAGRH